MKKLSLSLMLNVSLALMLALSLIYPQSVAVSFVAALAILATVICVVAGGVGGMPRSMYWNATGGSCRRSRWP